MKGSVWRLGRTERSRENYRVRHLPQGVSNTPRNDLTYRANRRNHSNLNRDEKDWLGTETKLRPEPVPLTLKTSARGETHYVELW